MKLRFFKNYNKKEWLIVNLLEERDLLLSQRLELRSALKNNTDRLNAMNLILSQYGVDFRNYKHGTFIIPYKKI